MEQKVKNKIKEAFDSLLRADYLSLDKVNELEELSDYYIDIFNTTASILQKQDSYISGRRGTGKTTALLKGYYECLKSLKSNSNLLERKILPIYIDLSSCSDLFDGDNIELFEVHFVRQIIDSLKRQLESFYDEKTLLVFKKDNPALDDLEYIEKMLINGNLLSRSRDENITSKSATSDKNSFEASLSLKHQNFSGKVDQSTLNEHSKTYTQTRGVNVHEFLNKINDILRKSKIDQTYLFLDEFSDLNSEYQAKFSKLLKSFLGSKTNLFIKIGVITDRFDFGDKIIIGRDIFPVPLDLNEHVERLGGLSVALKKLEEIFPLLIQKRLDSYVPEITFDSILKGNKSEIIARIARESIGVTRTVGLILQNAWKQSENNDCKIGLSEINYGIRSARRTYQKQYEGALKRRLIPGFYNDLWNELIVRAIKEKEKNPSRPASHMLIDPNRKEYFNVFKENFLIHLLEEGRSSKYGGNYNLYAFDFDICLDLNIKYAENKDEYTARRFIYDTVLANYDSYFTSSKLKSYKCPECNTIYEEQEVAKAKVKRCFVDDSVLDEIVHQSFEIAQGNFAEVEVKILGLIASLKPDEAMTAVEIADSVGCTRQKVSGWCSLVLAPKKQIFIRKGDKNYYYGEEE